MRAVVTRVSSASVTIDGRVNGQIGRGFLILLGIGPEDTEKEADKLAEKILGLRVFCDEAGKMNLGLEAVGGKGRRPSFTGAAGPERAIPLYEYFLSACARLGYPPQHGEFGADMQVASVNDGPVTLWVDTDDLA